MQGLPLTETTNHFQAQATIDGVVQVRLLQATRLHFRTDECAAGERLLEHAGMQPDEDCKRCAVARLRPACGHRGDHSAGGAARCGSARPAWLPATMRVDVVVITGSSIMPGKVNPVIAESVTMARASSQQHRVQW